MNDMYSSGLPYSDEIYHHGIPGQKWGVRRFQNPDGSLTSEGRKRYSKGGGESKSIKSGTGSKGKEFVKGAAAVSVKAASRLGEGIARGVKTKLAEKMPFMLNDEELEKYRDRLRRENTFRNEMANRRELKRRAQGDQFAKKLIQDVASTSLKKIAETGSKKLADELFKTANDRYKEQLAVEKTEYELEKHRKDAAENKLQRRVTETLNEINDIRDDIRDNKSTINKNKEKIDKIMSSDKPLDKVRFAEVKYLNERNKYYTKKNLDLVEDILDKRDSLKSQAYNKKKYIAQPQPQPQPQKQQGANDIHNPKPNKTLKNKTFKRK